MFCVSYTGGGPPRSVRRGEAADVLPTMTAREITTAQLLIFPAREQYGAAVAWAAT